MLLQHGWLADLSKPPVISEEDEELADELVDLGIGEQSMGSGIGGENMYDREVAEWCKAAMERKRLGNMGTAAKPALHAAPLDTVSPASSPASTA